jgi:hypothetical protein
MNNEKPGFWANGTNANIKEPHSALRETGWRYGDIPTASNFNWLFNQIQKDLYHARIEIKELRETKEKLELSIKVLNDEISGVKSTVTKVKKTADHSLDEIHLVKTYTSRNIDHLRKISIGLTDMTAELKQSNQYLRDRDWLPRDEFDLIDEHGQPNGRSAD